MESPAIKTKRLFFSLLAAAVAIVSIPAAGAAEVHTDGADTSDSSAETTEQEDQPPSNDESHDSGLPADGDDSSSGDNAEDSEHDFFGEQHRRELYREGRLHYSSAALRTALLPGLGNFYAEQYLLGGLNASLMGFAVVVIPYGLATDQPIFIWGGAGIAGTAYISGFITSAIGVKRYNRQLRRRLRLSSSPDALPPTPPPGEGTPWELSQTMIPVFSIPF
jgi:hypothetical protein